MDFSSLIDTVNGFFSGLFDGLGQLGLAVLNWCFMGMIYVISYPLIYLLEGVLAAVSAVLGALDFSAISIDWAGTILGLPGPMLYLLHGCGFDLGLSLIAGAIGIRVLLNLIPGALTRV